MKVWIDQDLCTGDGLCEDLAGDVFRIEEDGIAYVKEAAWPNTRGPDGTGDGAAYQGADGLADVPAHLAGDVLAAANACPGECIFVVDEPG